MGILRIGARSLAAQAEKVARSHQLAKRTALPQVLRAYLESAWYEIGEVELDAAVSAIERVRWEETLPAIQIQVRSDIGDWGRSFTHATDNHDIKRESNLMATVLNHPNTIAFFEAERVYPDITAQRWYMNGS
jgi:hypothetical protein